MTNKPFNQWRSTGIGQHQHRTSGFTLVELLVVVSIIALLISILLPSLKQAREQAKSIKCLAHSRGMGQAASVFATSHNGYMQISANQGDGQVGYSTSDRTSGKYEFAGDELKAWPVAIADASGSTVANNWDWAVRADTFADARAKQSKMSDGFEMFLCPADRVKIATPFYPNGTSIKGTGDPADPVTAGGGTKYWGLLSYAINEDIVGIEAQKKNNQPWPAVWKNGVWGESNFPNWADAGLRLQGNMDKVFDPGTCLLLADAGANTLQEAESGQFTNSTRTGYANLITSAQAFGPNLGNATARWVQRIPIKRHPKGVVNVTFADNHAASVKPTKFQTDTIEGISLKFPTEFGEQVRVSPYRPYVRQ
ncbi:MAG TPA: prepilin-type N-terminal cleavage/methylation domain-containing protein [Phycisphaerae bacterium]|nr:prepilin-type N-terminal cleavage/methylation domain-containing protein [Phycisphaerales bacterium]HNO78756.1 prepilin-type N-terminal cleavage/methylation domain-containing protein [Phycisphaerae bacterium]